MKKFTLEQWLLLADVNPGLKFQMSLQAADSAEELRSIVEDATDSVINEIVKHRQFKQDLSEDELTAELVGGLSLLGIPAVHGSEIGGRTDVSASMRFGFIWIAEAKLWKGGSWAYKGFRQLLTRYATGMPNQDHGALILYFDQPSVTALMEKWRETLERRTTITSDTERLSTVSFRTRHAHPALGADFAVRHFAVPLFWKPDDH